MACLDTYNRSINYLRISVTDRCNLRCTYCMPEDGVPSLFHDDILRYEEIVTIVRAAIELGITNVRLTGGEPLVRKGIKDLVSSLAGLPGIEDLSMTTNGVLLPRYASQLAEAGLKRVNVSLDTLRPDRFRVITRLGDLQDVLAGIEAARNAGLVPLKINMTVIRGMNDDEVLDMARKTIDTDWNVRFIEVMPVGNGDQPDFDWQGRVVTEEEIRRTIESQLGLLEPASVSSGKGPARYYRLPGAKGTLGFISPLSEHFCHLCNRLRLMADGNLRLCLLSEQEIDLRTPLRQGASHEEIKALLQQGIRNKPLQHHLDESRLPHDRAMSQIGG